MIKDHIVAHIIEVTTGAYPTRQMQPWAAATLVWHTWLRQYDRRLGYLGSAIARAKRGGR